MAAHDQSDGQEYVVTVANVLRERHICAHSAFGSASHQPE